MHTHPSSHATSSSARCRGGCALGLAASTAAASHMGHCNANLGSLKVSKIPHSSATRATFQVLKSHIWLVAAIRDSTGTILRESSSARLCLVSMMFPNRRSAALAPGKFSLGMSRGANACLRIQPLPWTLPLPRKQLAACEGGHMSGRRSAHSHQPSSDAQGSPEQKVR